MTILRAAPHNVRWVALGAVSGVLSGTASALFLTLLTVSTAMFAAAPSLVYALPLAGLLIGWLYWRHGRSAVRGTNLVLAELYRPAERIPLRMTPFVLGGTLLTHLFGGSAGREGTAVQMGASLADTLRRALGLGDVDRRLLILSGISGGFASVFGTPAAGFVFGLEVSSTGRIRYDAALPCLVAALVGDLTTRAWQVGHAHYPRLPAVELDPLLIGKVAVAAVAFGAASWLFVSLTHAIRAALHARVSWPPLRPVLGGLLIVALTVLVGSARYNSLGLPLIDHALTGGHILPADFLLKIVFTAVTVGSGFIGGEVTPLFAIGASLGAALAGPFDVQPAFLASVGFVSVFAGASKTPLACALMGVELFGGGAAAYILTGCVVAFVVSGEHSIYATQHRTHIPFPIAPAEAGSEVHQ